MKKKVLLYIILGLVISLGIYVLVSFVFNKDGTMYWINYIWDMLNQPLPIVGISSVALFVFCWNVVKYIRDTKPNQELAELKKEYEKEKQEKEQENKELKEQNSKYMDFIVRICELSTNQKIKNYGKELLGHGEESIDSETKAE